MKEIAIGSPEDSAANAAINEARANGTHKEPEVDHAAALEADREANRRAHAEQQVPRAASAPRAEAVKVVAFKKKPGTAKERRAAKRARK